MGALRAPIYYMRGDYVVVPPNSARVEVCVPEVLGSAPAPGPDCIINYIRD